MGSILDLLKLQIDNKTDLLKTASPKKMMIAILKVLLVLALITVVVAFILLRIFSLGVAVSEGLVAIVLLATQGISLFFAIGNIINTLYLCKDNEMLICLPVTPNQLFISKVLLIYLRELAVNALISIPLFITLGFLGGLGVSFYLSIPLLVLLLPIFPIVLASFISVPLMGVIRFLKKHVVLSILCILSLVAACLWGYISFIGAFAGNFNIANQQLETVRKINQVITSVGKHFSTPPCVRSGSRFSKTALAWDDTPSPSMNG
jgi:ABC-2 type transport system permease protein